MTHLRADGDSVRILRDGTVITGERLITRVLISFRAHALDQSVRIPTPSVHMVAGLHVSPFLPLPLLEDATGTDFFQDVVIQPPSPVQGSEAVSLEFHTLIREQLPAALFQT